jgi:hypothetical protein
VVSNGPTTFLYIVMEVRHEEEVLLRIIYPTLMTEPEMELHKETFDNKNPTLLMQLSNLLSP